VAVLKSLASQLALTLDILQKVAAKLEDKDYGVI
jgi:hypothetical protein